MKKSLLPFLLLTFNLFSHAQSIDQDNYPIIGKQCPDFVLRNIRYYPKKQATLKDFAGKWLVLDFWNTHCGACAASFPRVSAMQNEFGERVQFMMVGIEDKEGQVEAMFAKFREKENLEMPCAFDSLLANRWEVYSCPHVIILDEQGIVRAITSSYHREDMEGFLSGNPPHFDNAFRYDWEQDTRLPFDKDKPFLINGNGGNDSVFLFRSLLSFFDGRKQRNFSRDSITEDAASGQFQVLGFPLVNLYNYAFFGTCWPDPRCHLYPVLEIKDSSFFRYNSYNEFCYSLLLPPKQATKDRMQKAMQQDLQNYFGYDARIEERKFTCWRLTTTDVARRRLENKGGKHFLRMTHIGVSMQNCSFNELLGYIRRGTADDIIDETGIDGKVDITLDCIDTDFNAIRLALHANGLNLIKEDKSMNVLVIKDPKPTSN